MSAEPKPTIPTDESEVWNAISAFEQILEAMPTDRVALETLFEAYEQIGQTGKAVEYLVRLGENVAEERDAEAATTILAKLRQLAPDDPSAMEMAQRLEELAHHSPSVSSEETKTEGDTKRKSANITHELSLAWSLLQAGKLDQEQYSQLVQELSEGSSNSEKYPITVLQMLEGGDPEIIANVMAYMAKDSGTPMVHLQSFELDPETSGLLSLDFMTSNAAICFGSLGDEVMVAIQNPYDIDLRSEVEKQAGKRCHYYLAGAASYNATVDDLRQN